MGNMSSSTLKLIYLHTIVTESYLLTLHGASVKMFRRNNVSEISKLEQEVQGSAWTHAATIFLSLQTGNKNLKKKLRTKVH